MTADGAHLLGTDVLMANAGKEFPWQSCRAPVAKLMLMLAAEPCQAWSWRVYPLSSYWVQLSNELTTSTAPTPTVKQPFRCCDTQTLVRQVGAGWPGQVHSAAERTSVGV